MGLKVWVIGLKTGSDPYCLVDQNRNRGEGEKNVCGEKN